MHQEQQRSVRTSDVSLVVLEHGPLITPLRPKLKSASAIKKIKLKRAAYRQRFDSDKSCRRLSRNQLLRGIRKIKHSDAMALHSLYDNPPEPGATAINMFGVPTYMSELYSNVAKITGLYLWQSDALVTYYSQKSNFFCFSSTTSSGKSLVYELIGLYRLFSFGKRLLIVCPLISLVREKVAYLEKLLDNTEIKVSDLSRSRFSESADICVCTPDKANSVLMDAVNGGLPGSESGLGCRNFAKAFGTVVLDEFHRACASSLSGKGDAMEPHSGGASARPAHGSAMGGSGNHAGYESFLIKLSLVLSEISIRDSRIPKGDSRAGREDSGDQASLPLSIVACSATLPQGKQFERWIDELFPGAFIGRCSNEVSENSGVDEGLGSCATGSKPVCVYTGNPVYGVICPPPNSKPQPAGGVDSESLSRHDTGQSVTVFNAATGESVDPSEVLADEDIDTQNKTDLLNLIGAEAFLPVLVVASSRKWVENLAQSLNGAWTVDGHRLRAGIHHAGLSASEREAAEAGFKTGELDVLVCTTTLAAGVNLPAKRVVIRSMSVLAFSDDQLGTLLQIAGRAGRTGLQSAGDCVVMLSNEREAIQLKDLFKRGLSADASKQSNEEQSGEQEGNMNYTISDSQKDVYAKSLLECLACGLLSYAKVHEPENKNSGVESLAIQDPLSIQPEAKISAEKTLCCLVAETFCSKLPVPGFYRKPLAADLISLLTAKLCLHRSGTDNGPKTAGRSYDGSLTDYAISGVSVTPFGMAASCVYWNLRESYDILMDLQAAQSRVFLSETDLHLLYLCAPSDSVPGADDKKIQEVISLACSAIPALSKMVGPLDSRRKMIKVFTALILRDILNVARQQTEVQSVLKLSLDALARSYDLATTTLQSIYQSAIPYASVLKTFCTKLNMPILAHMMSSVVDMLQFPWLPPEISSVCADVEIPLSCIRRLEELEINSAEKLAETSVDMVARIVGDVRKAKKLIRTAKALRKMSTPFGA